MANLYDAMQRELGTRNIERTPIPLDITQNLNPRFGIRPYQERALRYFISYWDEDFDGKPRGFHQLLFLMATGSGKTFLMAACMAHLYAKGYRNFLFFVNSANIINKTRENFLNAASPKYLFAPSIIIGDKRVSIREVDNFAATSPHDINILFTTIQGLHTTILNPRENGLTLDDFQGQRVVLISDEAHHINVDTKMGAPVSQDDLFESLSWESTVMRIFQANPANVLLEFTATVDLSDPELARKYRPRLLVDYPLREFRRDGYSKEVKVLQADLEPWPRALQALVLSQYRRKVFEHLGKGFLPVVLMKSKTIAESKAFFQLFQQHIRLLDGSQLAQLATQCTDATVQKAFTYFQDNGITPDNLAMELREDFSPDKLLEVNSKEESEAKQLLVNSMETNGLRVVFAVDKLNEGWDVLNLYDIVRLYNTRDGKANAIGKTTMSEAQLIGRGARYCPFQASSEQPMYLRKYDHDVDHEYRVLEELYYHCAHNPKYVQELQTALTVLGIKAPQTRTVQMNLKPSFKDTPLYKAGFIFLNERLPYAREDVQGLPENFVQTVHTVSLRTGVTRTTLAFEESAASSATDIERKDYTMAELDLAVLRKAVQRIEFYEFATLRRHLPNLTSLHQFLTSPQYLASIKVEVSGMRGMVAHLDADQRLDVVMQVLHKLADVLASDKRDFKGSREFKPRMVKEVFTSKVLNFNREGGEDQEFGRSMNNPAESSAYHVDLSKRDWYVFDDCFGTSEEKLLIQYVEKRYQELSAVYAHVYLIRNEKHFKVYTFEDGRPMEPDFVLFLQGKDPRNTRHWQVFLEPKGQHLLRTDEWKERFLCSLKDQGVIEQLMENRQYVLWGLPFFNSVERMPAFEAAMRNLQAEA
ncbi:DEAD/DEAH box helicase family protein [Cupriavidus taiwanensis]|uniref:DEAD/DEAH box helicase family protein n=1 Tax=Cupriavidus taiwanensis TaxID=164546 RepID=UPI0039C1DA90